METFSCEKCERRFANEFNYKRHLTSQLHLRDGGAKKFQCEVCSASFARKDNFKRHKQLAHAAHEERLRFRCGLCKRCFQTREEVEAHREAAHVCHHDFRLQESAHCKQAQVLRAYFPPKVQTMDEALVYAFDHMRKLTTSLSVKLAYYKINFTMFVEMWRMGEDGEVSQAETFPFRGFGMQVQREKDITSELMRVCGDVDRNVEEFLYQGSGWMVGRPLYLEAEVVECLPLRGAGGGDGTCGLHLAQYRRMRGVMPQEVASPGEEDGQCFFYAIARHFCGEGAPTAYLKSFIEVTFPQSSKEMGAGGEGVTLAEIDRFEEENKALDLGINVVYRDESSQVVPVRASKNILAKNTIVLLLFHTARGGEEGEAEANMMHYAFVDNPSKIFAQRAMGSWGVMRTNDIFICFNCFNTIRSVGAYESHITFCHENKCRRVRLPKKGETLRYDCVTAGGGLKSDPRSFKSAFSLIFDFEALQIKADRPCSCSEELLQRRAEWEGMTTEERYNELAEQVMLQGERTEEWNSKQEEARRRGRRGAARPDPVPQRLRLPKMCEHKTRVLTNQPPFAYSLVLLDRDGVVREDKTYVGADAPENFIATVLNLADKYLPQLTPGEPMEEMGAEGRRRVLEAAACYLCGGEMEAGDKVLDHDHLNGAFLGVAHNACNLHRKEQLKLTCYAHNFSGYDSHFLIRAMNKFPERIHDISAIPLNTQKFKAISLNHRIRFVDSCQFLLDSLANLTETLKASGCAFKILDQLTNDEREKELLLRKGVYPYSFATSEERLRSTLSLPPRECFANDLRGEECSEEDYRHAQKVWEHFECESMLDYTTLYVRSDVYLLAEVVHDFRNLVWRNFQLDMCQYLSLPHLAKDIMLKHTGAEIDLLDDQAMSDLLQKNIRGGLSYVGTRHAKRVTKEEAWLTRYNLPWKERPKRGEKEKKDTLQPKSMLYIDANNLYGKAMSFPLPLRDFRWMTEEEIAQFEPELDPTLKNGPGYILEVDLEYPEELHIKHNSFPLAPESVDLEWGDLSPYSKSCLRAFNYGADKTNYRSKKLTSTFRTRRKYVVHGVNLRLYLELGLVLKKIHRGITFHQEAYIEPFVTKCTQMRSEATTKSEQNMWKLICNATYGKMIESQEKRMDCRFNATRDRALRNSSSPLYKGTLVCGEDLSISFHQKKEVQMKQCWALGFSILELSKWYMQFSYYKRIIPSLHYGEMAVVMSDTDSFLLVTNKSSPTRAMRDLAHLMDFSNLDLDHRLYDKSRCRVPGYFKNEIPNDTISEAVALKSKTYGIATVGGKTVNKAKGVTEAAKAHLHVPEYRRCLQGIAQVEVTQNSIRSSRHINQMLESRKVAFSSFDDKRYLLCPVHSVPYGSKLIRRKECYFCEHPDQLY